MLYPTVMRRPVLIMHHRWYDAGDLIGCWLIEFIQREFERMMRRVITYLLLVLFVSALAGCDAVGSLLGLGGRDQGGGDTRAEVASLIDPLDAHQLGYASFWATDLSLPSDQQFSHIEVLGDMLVCVEVPSNLVTVISLRDGEIKWRQVVGKPTEKMFTPVRAGELLLLNTEQLLHTIAIDSGRLVKTSQIESLVNHAPAVAGDLAIYGGVNHRVFAHDIKAGYTKWAYQLSERVFARPAVFGDNVFVADGNGIYAMFNANSGELMWRGRTFARVSAQPAMSPLGVFVAGEDHSVYALHLASGRDRWIYHTTQPLRKSPRVLGNTVFLSLPGRGLVAIDTRTGSDRWVLPFEMRIIGQVEDTLLAYTADRIVKIKIANGLVLTEVSIDPVWKILQASGNRLILASPAGRILLLNPV